MNYCIKLAIWMMILFYLFGTDPDPERTIGDERAFGIRYGTAVFCYIRSNPEDLNNIRELSETETVSITNRIDIPKTKYLRTGAVSVVMRNRKISSQYNIELWRNCKRGVPYLGSGAYIEISLDDYKKQLAKINSNYNSTVISSRYDGIGNEFFRDVSQEFFNCRRTVGIY